jgi:hypothetical protein
VFQFLICLLSFDLLYLFTDVLKHGIQSEHLDIVFILIFFGIIIFVEPRNCIILVN